MTKTQLINRLHEKLEAQGTPAPKTVVREFLETFQETVIEGLRSDGKVNITGFLNFSKKKTPARPARQGRNPSTGEPMTFKAKPAGIKVRAGLSLAFREAVAAPKRAKK